MSGPQPILLSWPLGPSTPAYGGGEGFAVQELTSTRRGDTANTVRITMPNHLGTHVDAPRHFFDGATDVPGLPASHWLFLQPTLLDVQVGDGELVGPEHLPAGGLASRTDLLLLRTGHGRTRGTDRYWQAGPGLSAELGTYLRREHPSIRCVGMDLISVTSRLRREAGREAHRAFLDPDRPGTPIVLVEDMALASAPARLGMVLISPLFFDAADGAPVTVWSFPTPGPGATPTPVE